jgi:hypothetical protein
MHAHAHAARSSVPHVCINMCAHATMTNIVAKLTFLGCLVSTCVFTKPCDSIGKQELHCARLHSLGSRNCTAAVLHVSCKCMCCTCGTVCVVQEEELAKEKERACSPVYFPLNVVIPVCFNGNMLELMYSIRPESAAPKMDRRNHLQISTQQEQLKQLLQQLRKRLQIATQQEQLEKCLIVQLVWDIVETLDYLGQTGCLSQVS